MNLKFYSALFLTALVLTNVQASESYQPGKPRLHELKKLFNKQKRQQFDHESVANRVKSLVQPNELMATATVSQNDSSPLVMLAAGTFEDTKGLHYPLIARSQNGGSDWFYVLDDKTITFPKDFVEIAITPYNGPYISCSAQDCVYVTHYQSSMKKKGIPTPLFLTTHDGGLHWFSTLDHQSPGANQRDWEYINALSCDHGVCVAAGGGGNKYSPLLIVSQDAGKSWKYIHDEQISPESGVYWGDFQSVSCDDLTCIAVGSYLKNEDLSQPASPLIAISRDKGAHWIYTSSVQKSEDEDWSLNSVSCHGQYCIAGGETVNSYPDSEKLLHKPIIMTSQDYGVHWDYVHRSQLSTIYKDFDGYISQVHCDAEGFVAEGIYLSENQEEIIPLTGISHDFGLNWQFKTERLLSSYPDENYPTQSFYLNGYPTCSGTTCVTTGIRWLKDDEHHSGTPLLAISWDKALSWQFPVDLNVPSLPTGFKSGEFDASAFVEEPRL